MTDIKQRIAFKAVLVNKDGNVLLLREATTYKEGTNIGRYHFPGGRLEPGEAWQDGLNREVREETGLAVEIEKPLYVGEWRPIIRDVPHQIVAIFMVCRVIDDTNIRLSDEHDDYQWVTDTSWHSLDVMPPDDEVLKTYFSQNS
jgi:8-oxo-dGTP diphosphatase